MEITIDIRNVIADVKYKSSLEVSAIKDMEERYRVEAGTEKDDEIQQALVTAHAGVVSLMAKFIVTPNIDIADDLTGIPDVYTYRLAMGPRRSMNTAQPLATAVHDYMVHSILSTFYDSMASPELRDKHTGAANTAAATITNLLYTKANPRMR